MPQRARIARNALELRPFDASDATLGAPSTGAPRQNTRGIC
jgi:hypothetical protein